MGAIIGEFSFSYWVKLPVDNNTDPRGVFDFSGDGGDGPQSLFIQAGANPNRLAFRVDGAGSANALALVDVPERRHLVFRRRKLHSRRVSRGLRRLRGNPDRGRGRQPLHHRRDPAGLFLSNQRRGNQLINKPTRI